MLELLGDDTEVPCLDGRSRKYANLDYAASAPMLRAVWEAVEAFLPWYSSVHRGTGVKSQVATAAYEDARGDVAAFVGARPDDAVVFVRNTTEAINVLSASLPPGTKVLSTPVEHHANMLPWRRHDLRTLPFPSSADELLDLTEAELRHRPADLLAVTGASNVTGEVWPVAALAEIAHERGAELFVDAAQLAPHRPIDMAATGIDHLAFSGHKLYAPLGAGALVGRPTAGEPLLHGGGAVRLVTLDEVIWERTPERYEAGSPNVVGVIALAAACRALTRLGMTTVAAHERALARRLWASLERIPGLRSYTLWPVGSVDRVGVATFNLDGLRHPLVAAALSAEHAIGVRHGCFCAHPLITHLLELPCTEVERLRRAIRAGERPPLPGAVRASPGLGTTAADLSRLTSALADLSARGPRRRYEYLAEHDEYRPADDRRMLAA
jgi:selenocysteine lyase/cysteine desulfurase